MLDGETPDVQIITNRGNNVVYEAPIYSNSKPDSHIHKRNLVSPRPEYTGPQPEPWTDAVYGRKLKRNGQDVVHGKFVILNQMGSDYLTNGVGIY